MIKAEKIEAGYASSPSGFSCGVCRHFRNGKCKLVSGNIRKKDCCNLFSNKGFKPSLEGAKLKRVC